MAGRAAGELRPTALQLQGRSFARRGFHPGPIYVPKTSIATRASFIFSPSSQPQTLVRLTARRPRSAPLGTNHPGRQTVLSPRRPYSTMPSSAAPIETFRTVADFRKWRKQFWGDTLGTPKTLGYVPTMGALHEGHLQLCRAAAQQHALVVVSIFVNPTQFGVGEDLEAYPRTYDSDMQQLDALNAELARDGTLGMIAAVFAPTTREMYPGMPPSSEIDGKGTFVTVTPVGEKLEGASRPVFFRGVATVCAKLFNIVQPDAVYLGQKDVQQTVVLGRLVKDLHFDTQIVVVPTAREPDGLARSSRNVYLGARRRRVAPVLIGVLNTARDQAAGGATKRGDILGPALAQFERARAEQDALPLAEAARFELDYLSLADPETMEELETVNAATGAILSIAVRMLPVELGAGEDGGEAGGASRIVRLIDNIIIDPR